MWSRGCTAPEGRIVSKVLKSPVFIVVLAGILIRIVLMPILTYDFDISHWALIIGNMQSGNDLYGLAGYYYTPIWGYILGFLSLIQDLFLNMGATGMRVTEMIPIEGLAYPYYTANLTTLSFNIFIKVALLLCDLAVAYILYWVVKERTGDTKKATFGMALWFLCPVVIYMCGIQAQFDTFSVLIFMLAVVAAYKGRYTLAGFVFATSILLKFFPMFCAIVLVAYVLKKHREDGQGMRNLAHALIGAVAGVIIWMLPSILNGTFADALTFVTNRISAQASIIVIANYVAIFIALAGMVFSGYRMHKSEGDVDADYFKYMFMAIASSMFMGFAPQYMLVMIPLLVIYMTDSGKRRLLICWILASVGSVLLALSLNNFSLFASLAVDTGWISPEWVINAVHGMNATFLGITWIYWGAAGASIMMLIGFALIFFFFFEKQIRARIGSIDRLMGRIEKRWGEKHGV